MLLLLTLAPIVFVPRSGDAFEPPRAFLLGTAMATLVTLGLARTLAGSRARAFSSRPWPAPIPWLAKWIRGDPLSAAVALFLVSSAVSTVFSIRPVLSLLGESSQPAGLTTAVATAAVFFASRAVGGSVRALARIAIAASFAASVAVAYALIQWAGLDPVPWVWTATLGGVVRVPGTLGHPNHLGTYLAMTLPLVLLLARRSRSTAARGACLFLAGASLFVLGITLSRGAWLALLAGAVSFGLVSLVSRRKSRAAAISVSPAEAGSRNFRRALAWAGGALVLFLLPLLTSMGPSFLDRLRQIADLQAPTTQTRLLLWRSGFRMLSDHPVVGVGTDAFSAVFPHYRTPEFMRLEWASTSLTAHNELIQIGATQGLLGLMAALLVVGFAVRAVLRVAAAPDPAVKAVAAPVGAALAAWAVSSLSSFTVIATGSLAAGIGGWMAGQARSASAPPDSARAAGRSTPRSWVIAVALGAGIWAPLTLVPWLASDTASRGIGDPITSPSRAQALVRASAIAPWDERYALELGRTLLAQAYAAQDLGLRSESLQRAGAALERAVRIASENAESRALLAMAHATEASLRPDRARASEVDIELRSVLAADSTTPTTLDLVANGYVELGLDGPAHAVSLRCAQLYPGHAQPMADIGRIALAEGRYSDAADTLALALERDWHGNATAGARARSSYAVALLRLGRAREAWEEASRALRSSPSLRVAERIRDEAARALKPGPG